MKRIAILTLLIVLFLCAYLFLSPADQPTGSTLWATLWSVVFGVCVVHWTGRSWLFVFGTAFAICAAFPFAMLCFIGRPVYGSWLASATTVMSYIQRDNPLGVFQLIVPAVFAAIVAWSLGRRALTVHSSGRAAHAAEFRRWAV
jgi:hypothetical protein